MQSAAFYTGSAFVEITEWVLYLILHMRANKRALFKRYYFPYMYRCKDRPCFIVAERQDTFGQALYSIQN